MSELTADYGRFAAGFDAVPPEATAVALGGVTDAFGVLLAGRNELVVRAACAVCGADPAVAVDVTTAGASVLMSAARTRPADAALINATAAHALAIDDVAAGCHPSAMLMPALLALGEARGLSGRALLRAYVIGYELLADLAAREADSLHTAGWHPSSVLGPPAVAGAAAALIGLTAAQCAHAIGIAASMSGGLVANFGTPTKALHVGRAAAAGVQAALLAEQGVTATTSVLEQATGLLSTLSPGGRVDLKRPFNPAREGLRILTQRLCVKKYPVCYSTHRIVDAAVDLASQPGFDPARIARIDVTIGRTQAWMAAHHRPQTDLEARYSVEFAVAAGLSARAAGFAQLDESFIRSAPVQRLVAATQIELREGRSADDPLFSPSDRVVLTLDDGGRLDSGEVEFARGHARLPLSADDLKRKFLDCANYGGYPPAQSLHARLGGLADLQNLRDLTASS